MPRSRYMAGLVFHTFIVISLLANILVRIVPDIISSFHVSLTAPGFLALALFTYGVMSIPAGSLVEPFREKPLMIVAFVAGKPGSLSFTVFPEHPVAVVSLFVTQDEAASSHPRRKRCQFEFHVASFWRGRAEQ